MDLRQQYKNEMQRIAPSEEQSERIRARVYEEIQKPLKAPKRKLPLKAIAITGASAACLVLAATFTLHFTLEKEALVNPVADEALTQNDGIAIGNDAGESAGAAKTISEGYDPATDRSVSAPGKSLLADVYSIEYAAALRIELNEELSECVVYSGDDVKTYALSNEAKLTDDDEKLLTKIPKDRSSLGEELFVCIKDGKIWVYDRNRDFLGAFVETA